MKRILFLLFFLTCGFISSARAEQGLPQGDFSELRQTGMVVVRNVIDPLTIQLEDGHIIRMAGVDFPDFNPEDPGEFSLTTLKVLKDMLEGKTVILYQTVNKDEGRINRMGQDIAQLQRQDDKAWVQGTLLALGLARARTAQRNPEMAQQMYDLEDQARQEKAGIWEKYKVLTPDETPGTEGSFQIVKGRIQSAALKQNRIYLNFGSDWKSDFTVSISPEDKRIFSKQNLDPLQWNGKWVRVRGWMESNNGPFIEINHPQAIEIMENPPTPKNPSELPETDELPNVGK